MHETNRLPSAPAVDAQDTQILAGRGVLWISDAGAPARPLARGAETGLDASGSIRLLPLSARTPGEALAVALVPDRLAGAASRNGVPMEAGLHRLLHADRLVCGGRRVWVATSAEPERAPYDAQTHGADLFCARTKMRLAPGEPVVLCPGTPDRACGLISKAEAFDLPFPCAECGFDPRAPRWAPPAETPARRSSDALLRRIVRAR